MKQVYAVCREDDPHHPMDVEAIFTTEELANQYKEQLEKRHPYSRYAVVPYDLYDELPQDEEK